MKWSDLRIKKLSPAELRRIDQEVEGELLKMDLRTLSEAGKDPLAPPSLQR